MKIFISGPMTGIKDYNFPEFNRVARMLRNRGWEVVNPVDICLQYSVEKVLSDKSEFDKMINDELEALKTCDAIYMMKGWENSRGANKEYRLARLLHIHCLYEQNGLFRKIIRNIKNWAYEVDT